MPARQVFPDEGNSSEISEECSSFAVVSGMFRCLRNLSFPVCFHQLSRDRERVNVCVSTQRGNSGKQARNTTFPGHLPPVSPRVPFYGHNLTRPQWPERVEKHPGNFTFSKTLKRRKPRINNPRTTPHDVQSPMVHGANSLEKFLGHLSRP